MLYATGLAVVAGLVVGLLRGGRLRWLGRHRLRAWWLVVAGFGLQLLSDHTGAGRLATAMVIGGAAALIAFTALNPTLVGMGVIAVGVGCNALVIGLNGGMPVKASAVVAAHIVPAYEEQVIDYGSRHHRLGPGDTLSDLGDIIPVPLFHEVVSFGDLILACGVASTIAHLLRRGPRHARSGEP